jgi:hypothetical protein
MASDTEPDRRRATRRWVNRSGVLLLACALFILFAIAPMGCTTKVIPPANLAEPRKVFLLDHGRTPSLVLTTDDGTMVRYVYGDWRFYALMETGPLSAVAAVLWPTRGTLGRDEMAGPATPERPRVCGRCTPSWSGPSPTTPTPRCSTTPIT